MHLFAFLHESTLTRFNELETKFYCPHHPIFSHSEKFSDLGLNKYEQGNNIWSNAMSCYMIVHDGLNA